LGFFASYECGWLGMVVHTCNPSTGEAEAGGSWVWGQPELKPSQKNRGRKKKKVLAGGMVPISWRRRCLAFDLLWCEKHNINQKNSFIIFLATSSKAHQRAWCDSYRKKVYSSQKL
jgi:hypothetical protein